MSMRTQYHVETPPEGTPEWDSWAAQDKGPAIAISCWFFTALALLFVFGRLFVRWRMYKHFKADDYWCTFGMICAIISTAMCQVAINNGSGRHFPILSRDHQESVIFWTIIGICPGVISLGVPKFAVVSLLVRLLNPSKYHRWFLWTLATVCFLSVIGITGTLLGQCDPMESQWNFDIKGECVDMGVISAYSIYGSSFSAFTDFYLAVYPAVVLFGLQMKLRKKIILMVALGIGMVSGSIAIYKASKVKMGLESADFSYESADPMLWTIIEASTIIIACTIPVLGPLFEYLPTSRLNPCRKAVLRRRCAKNIKPRENFFEKDSENNPDRPWRRRNNDAITDMDLEETIVGDNNSQDGFMDKAEKVSHDDCCGSDGDRRDDCTGTKTEVRYSAGFNQLTGAMEPPPPPAHPNHIVRTSEVSVSYSTVPPPEPAWPLRAAQAKTARPPSTHK